MLEATVAIAFSQNNAEDIARRILRQIFPFTDYIVGQGSSKNIHPTRFTASQAAASSSRFRGRRADICPLAALQNTLARGFPGEEKECVELDRGLLASENQSDRG